MSVAFIAVSLTSIVLGFLLTEYLDKRRKLRTYNKVLVYVELSLAIYIIIAAVLVML